MKQNYMASDQKITVDDFLVLLDDVFLEPEGTITIDLKRDEIPGWDSLGILSLMAEMDEKFDILLDANVIGGFESVADIVSILRQNGALLE